MIDRKKMNIDLESLLDDFRTTLQTPEELLLKDFIVENIKWDMSKENPIDNIKNFVREDKTRSSKGSSF